MACRPASIVWFVLMCVSKPVSFVIPPSKKISCSSRLFPATWRYNNTFHRGLPSKAPPFDASLRQNEDALMKFFYTYKHRVLPDNKFKVGDRVRIATETGWSQSIFVIAEIKSTEPYTYKVRSAETNEIHKKSFYLEELQKTQA